MKSWFGAWLNLALAVLMLGVAALCVIVFRGEPGPVVSGNGPALEIRNSDTGRVYGSWPLAASPSSEGDGEFTASPSSEGDGGFAIEFVHSVHNRAVREMFRAEGNEIVPAGVRFYSFGAGMQSDLEAGQVISRDGDALVINGSDRRFRELRYIVGTVSDHLLYINGETISLRDLCGRNAHITISITQKQR